MRMRWLVLAVVVLSLFATAGMAAEKLSLLYVDAKKGISEAMHAKMQASIVSESRVDMVCHRLQDSERDFGNVYVVAGRDLKIEEIGPSDLYLRKDFVDALTNGQLDGVMRQALYFQRFVLEPRYMKMSGMYNSLITGGGSGENARQLLSLAATLVDAFSQQELYDSDAFVKATMAKDGYPDSEYLDLLKSPNAVGPFLSNNSKRVEAYEKLPAGPTVTRPAPTSEQQYQQQKFADSLSTSDRFAEIDPQPFLDAFYGKPPKEEGWTKVEIRSGILLFLKRGGEVVKKEIENPFFVPRMAQDSNNMPKTGQYLIDVSRKELTTEGVVVVRNPRASPFFVVMRIGKEIGLAGLPPEYQNMGTVNGGFPVAHGDWPRQDRYLALKFKLGDLPRGNTDVMVSIALFDHPGEELDQFTATPRQVKFRHNFSKFWR